MNPIIRGSDYGQPVPPNVGKWTDLEGWFDTKEDAATASPFADIYRCFETEFDMNDLTDALHSWLYGGASDPDFLFATTNEQRKLLREKLTLAVSSWLTECDLWPKNGELI